MQKEKIVLLSQLKPRERGRIIEVFRVVGHLEAMKDSCGNCKFWRGRCDRGKINRVASSRACESFKRRRP